jgi:hypothetical protein
VRCAQSVTGDAAERLQAKRIPIGAKTTFCLKRRSAFVRKTGVHFLLNALLREFTKSFFAELKMNRTF